MRVNTFHRLAVILLSSIFACNLCVASEIDFAFNLPHAVATDKVGNVYVADLLPSGRLYKIDLSHKVTVLLDKLSGDLHMATDNAGNIYLNNGDTIQKVESTGLVTTIAKSNRSRKKGSTDHKFWGIGGVAIDKAGNIYVTAYAETDYAISVNCVLKISPSGKITSLFQAPISKSHTFRGIAIDGVGDIYFSDEYNHTIHKITPEGVDAIFAGVSGQFGDADGAGSEARFFKPMGVSIDNADNIYVADTGNGAIRRITPSGKVTTLAGSAEALGQPVALALDKSGNIYVADMRTQFIHKISPAGVISVFAGIPDGYGHRNQTLCRNNESVYFSCTVNGGKVVSVCGSRIIDESHGYLQYRFGKEKAIELKLPDTLVHPSQFFTQTKDIGMRQQSATLKIKNGAYAYTVYFTQGTGIDLANGVVITNNKKLIADMHCGENFAAGNMFFDESVIKLDHENE